MSKIVTICLALDLMEDGIISLDDSVIKYIPEFSDLKVAITKTVQNTLNKLHNEDSSRKNLVQLNM